MTSEHKVRFRIQGLQASTRPSSLGSKVRVSRVRSLESLLSNFGITARLISWCRLNLVARFCAFPIRGLGLGRCSLFLGFADSGAEFGVGLTPSGVRPCWVLCFPGSELRFRLGVRGG